MDSLDSPVVKTLPSNAGGMGSIPSSGRSPGVGNGNPHCHSCLKNPKDLRSASAGDICSMAGLGRSHMLQGK